MKLLVCDDDISTIDVLQSNLDCVELGISKILRAYNGEMAKQIIDEEKPELIICDIGMPICNGLEVLKYVSDQGLNSEFTFLTCYEKFEYAQMAIEYGVTAYLTKPFDLEEVKNCLVKMIDNHKKKEDKEEVQSRKDSLMTSVFKQACDGMLGTNKEMVDTGLKINGMGFTADSIWRIVYTRADIVDAIKNGWNKELLLFTINRLHDEVLTNYVGSAHTVVNSDDRFIWSFCFVKDAPEGELLKQRCAALGDFCVNHMHLNPVTLISEPFCFYETTFVVARLYDQMRKAKFYPGEIFFEKEESATVGQEDIALSENQVFWYLKNRDEEGYSDYIDSVLEKTYCTKGNLDQIRKEITNLFITYFRDNGMSINNIFTDQEINKLDERAGENRNSLKEYALALFEMQQTKAKEAFDSEDIIARAKRYIDEHFRDDIDRNDVAAVIFVTPNYLSKLFKNNMNMNLREYINQLRIEESKRLLLSTDLSVSEIATQVGYCNISYFSTVFHKLMGVGPFEWRSAKEETK